MAKIITNDTTTPEVVKEHSDTVPYDRFVEVISAKKALEDRLTKLESDAKIKQDAEDAEKAKKTGEYEVLVAKIKQQSEAMKLKAQNMALESLAMKHGMLKPEYVKLFAEKLEVDDNLEIKNLKEVEKKFVEEFKVNNAILFKPADNGKQHKVPAVDTSKPISQKEISGDEQDLTRQEKMRLGMEEMLPKTNIVHLQNLGTKE